MKIAIIKYNAGNLFSVDCALKRLGVEPVITNDKETLLSADKVNFSGSGRSTYHHGLPESLPHGSSHQRTLNNQY